MNIEISVSSRYAVLRLSGDFETYAIGDFLEAVREAREDGRNILVLNMRKVKFLNSTAIGAILRARKECKAAGGGLAIARPSAFVRETFDKLGLATIVPQFEEEEAAAEALRTEALQVRESVEAEEDSALFFRFYEQAKADVLGSPGRRRRRDRPAGPGWAHLRLVGPSPRAHPRTAGRVVQSRHRDRGQVPAAALQPLHLLPEPGEGHLPGDRGRRREGPCRVHRTGRRSGPQAVRQYVADMALVRDEIETAQRDS